MRRHGFLTSTPVIASQLTPISRRSLSLRPEITRYQLGVFLAAILANEGLRDFCEGLVCSLSLSRRARSTGWSRQARMQRRRRYCMRLVGSCDRATGNHRISQLRANAPANSRSMCARHKRTLKDEAYVEVQFVIDFSHCPRICISKIARRSQRENRSRILHVRCSNAFRRNHKAR